MKQLFTLFRSALVSPFLLSCLLGAFVGCLLLLASCGGDDSSEVPPPPKTEVTLSVAPADLTYDPASPSSNVVTVTTNASWKAECPDSKLKFSPSSGTGNATIAFTDAPAGVRCTLTVTAGTGADAKKQTVEIFREADVPVQTVFSLDFGNGTNGVWAGSNDEWKTQTGTGASTVTYSVNNVRINNDNFGSAGKYTGASGKAYAKMFYDASTDYFTIHDITLPEGERNYTLTFGTIFPAADVSLMVSADGAVWRPLAYTGASAYNTWAKATVGFTLKQAVAKLSIRLAPTGTERTYGLNFDDIVLTTGGGGQEVDPVAGTDLRWAELPSNFESPSADQFVHTTWTTTVTSGRRVRNYTYCYDTRRHNPVWVAYPHHRCYMEGSGRSDEPWAADPALPESQQSKIYASSTGDTYQYWTADLVTGAYGSGYWSRGHLCMSRERPGKGLEINVQTFRPTNVAPQASEPSAFGKIWGNIEEAISGGTIPADTLYIVAGCYYENDNNWKEKDASNNGALSSLSKDCVMPTRQFKMAVRKKTVQVGKPIQECTADELETIAFWVESLTKSTATDKSQLDQFIVPISEIETAMGMKFFPGIPDAAKSRKGTLSAWY
ncbi:DNA/RNA non-specific endonuclease [Alistipes sp. D31t1_170403_E11]|uniref:DNA/RNA non-specific endonuclease n=1 Tax=Alistipes sp. D31t1_170403_E11 TaxID=2787128 RepID=UPI0018986135|nr:DNA/RNA non-specific endonuclease [Alistipes sp. D31t1_170403_E11]